MSPLRRFYFRILDHFAFFNGLRRELEKKYDEQTFICSLHNNDRIYRAVLVRDMVRHFHLILLLTTQLISGKTSRWYLCVCVCFLFISGLVVVDDDAQVRFIYFIFYAIFAVIYLLLQPNCQFNFENHF